MIRAKTVGFTLGIAVLIFAGIVIAIVMQVKSRCSNLGGEDSWTLHGKCALGAHEIVSP